MQILYVVTIHSLPSSYIDMLQQLYIKTTVHIIFKESKCIVHLLITTSRSRFPVILYYGTQRMAQHQASAAILLQSNFLI